MVCSQPRPQEEPGDEARSQHECGSYLVASAKIYSALVKQVHVQC